MCSLEAYNLSCASSAFYHWEMTNWVASQSAEDWDGLLKNVIFESSAVCDCSGVCIEREMLLKMILKCTCMLSSLHITLFRNRSEMLRTKPEVSMMLSHSCALEHSNLRH